MDIVLAVFRIGEVPAGYRSPDLPVVEERGATFRSSCDVCTCLCLCVCLEAHQRLLIAHSRFGQDGAWFEGRREVHAQRVDHGAPWLRTLAQTLHPSPIPILTDEDVWLRVPVLLEWGADDMGGALCLRPRGIS